MYVRDLNYWKKRLGDDFEFDDLLRVESFEKDVSVSNFYKDLNISKAYLSQVLTRKSIFNDKMMPQVVRALSVKSDVAAWALMNYYKRSLNSWDHVVNK